MSMIQFGLPFNEPVAQTIIPVLDQYGKAYGFFPIAKHTFAGTETSYTLPDGTVAITSVTLPQGVSSNLNTEPVNQYMAAVYSPTQTPLKPWLGFTEFVSSAIPNNISYYSWWSMPTSGWIQHFGLGTFLESLAFNIGAYTFVAPSSNGNPSVSNGTLRWETSVDLAAMSNQYSFVDFNWLDLFSASLKQVPSFNPGSQVIPLSITTVSNPAGGYFKASVLQGSAAQGIYPGGGVIFNTIRILRLADPAPGTYTFQFAVTDNQNNTTDVTLTLTVV